jgi:hypothetical protein
MDVADQAAVRVVEFSRSPNLRLADLGEKRPGLPERHVVDVELKFSVRARMLEASDSGL